jgi:ADP-ribosyl-[dinitrogen reductase] hydrolase
VNDLEAPFPAAGSPSVPSFDRVLGALLGGAIGDALGLPIEFEGSTSEIAARFGASGPSDLAYAGPALVSDDTQMTLFSAEALIRARGAGRGDTTAFALGAYQRWLATQELAASGARRPRRGQGLLLGEARLFARRAPGNTCLAALALSFTRARMADLHDPPNGSKGCGAVMRAAPFGLAAASRERAFVTSRDAAVLTHGHPSGYLSAAVLSALLYDLVRGQSLEAALRWAEELLLREPEHEELWGKLRAAELLARQGPPSARALEELGGGWVGEEALAIALACALPARAEDVRDALWSAVAHGGDSDSTGSIAGNLLGARFGVAALPAEWRAAVELSDLIERVAKDLHGAAHLGWPPDPTDYPPVDGVFRLSHPM